MALYVEIFIEEPQEMHTSVAIFLLDVHLEACWSLLNASEFSVRNLNIASRDDTSYSI